MAEDVFKLEQDGTGTNLATRDAALQVAAEDRFVQLNDLVARPADFPDSSSPLRSATTSDDPGLDGIQSGASIFDSVIDVRDAASLVFYAHVTMSGSATSHGKAILTPFIANRVSESPITYDGVACLPPCRLGPVVPNDELTAPVAQNVPLNLSGVYLTPLYCFPTYGADYMGIHCNIEVAADIASIKIFALPSSLGGVHQEAVRKTLAGDHGGFQFPMLSGG